MASTFAVNHNSESCPTAETQFMIGVLLLMHVYDQLNNGSVSGRSKGGQMKGSLVSSSGPNGSYGSGTPLTVPSARSSFLIGLHETAVADHIGSQDSGKPALKAFLGHGGRSLPDAY